MFVDDSLANEKVEFNHADEKSHQQLYKYRGTQIMTSLASRIRNFQSIIGILTIALLLGSALSGETCVTDGRCKSDYGQMYICEDSKCIRENYSYSFREVAGFFFSMFVSIVTSTGGVGAGTMIVPTYIFFLQFNSGDSVHLSRFSLFGGSLFYFLLNWKRRDPKYPDRLMINYNLASMMVPLHIAGAEFGVIVGKFLPMIIVSIMLIFLLYMSLYKTYERAHQESGKEAKDIVKKEIEKPNIRNSTLAKSNSINGLINSPNNTSKVDMSESLANTELVSQSNCDESGVSVSECEAAQTQSPPTTTTTIAETRSQEHEIYTGHFATVKVSELIREHHGNFAIFVVASSVNILSTLIRGGEGRPSILGLDACSESTWKVLLSSQLACVFLAFIGYSRNYAKMEHESQETMTMLKDRVVRNKLIVASYVTGLAAGMAGVGGGMVLSIYMLSLGVDMGTAGSLSMFAVLFSASSTCIQSIMVGGIHLRHAYTILVMAFIGSLIGTLGLRRLLQMLNKPSFILWVLVGVLSVAALVLPIQTLTAVFKHPQITFSLGTFC